MSTNDMTSYDYWAEVASLAQSITMETFDDLEKDDQAEAREDNNYDAFREALDERLWETIDGHQWVIYTAYNYDVMRFSLNDGYSADNFGVESIISDGQLDTARIAYGALYADVMEHSDFGVIPELADA